MVNSFYQWTIVTKFSVLDVETAHPPIIPPEHKGLDDKAFQLSVSPFVKVDSKQDFFLMCCLCYLVLFHCIYLLFVKVDSKQDYFLMCCLCYLVLFHCIYLLLSFLLRINK